MHLSVRLPLTLLVAAAAVLATPPQSPWDSASLTSKTLVDVLGEDPDYSSLLLLLQRARLIPTLNRLDGATLFAPTNDAISKHSLTNSLWRETLEGSSAPDNINEQLRQQLFYHLLNESLSALPTEKQIPVYKTLLYPRNSNPPTRKPPPSPPWMPIPNGTLGHEPQRIRLAAHGKSADVGVDAFGKGGVNVVKELQEASNGVLLGIGEVLEPPPDLGEYRRSSHVYSAITNYLATVISQHSSISFFHDIMTTELMRYLNATSETTLFVPTDAAWDALHPIERMYLESEFASNDLRKILDMHSVIEEHVTWSDSFKSGLNCKIGNLND